MVYLLFIVILNGHVVQRDNQNKPVKANVLIKCCTLFSQMWKPAKNLLNTEQTAMSSSFTIKLLSAVHVLSGPDCLFMGSCIGENGRLVLLVLR